VPVPLLHHAAEAHLEVHLPPAAVIVEDVAAGEGYERLIAVEGRAEGIREPCAATFVPRR
jgi:hypothetical protein